MLDFRTSLDFFPHFRFRRSSSVPAYAGPPSPRGKVRSFAAKLQFILHNKSPPDLKSGGSVLTNAVSGYHEPTVFQGIFAGGQADQLVAVDRCEAGVVKRQFLTSCDEGIKFLF